MGKNSMWQMLATVFYVGRVVPFGAGTLGTVLAIPLVYFLSQLGPLFFMGLTLVFIMAASFVAECYERQSGIHDASEVIIDEVAGYMVTMTLVPVTYSTLLMGFFLFRVFDIFKPFPISYIDKKVSGGFGAVMDDVGAGLVCNILLQLIVLKTNWLGSF